MSTYLRNLVARTIGAANVVQPNLGARFLPGRGNADASRALTATSDRNLVRPRVRPDFPPSRGEGRSPRDPSLTSVPHTPACKSSKLAVGVNERSDLTLARGEIGDREAVQTSPIIAPVTSQIGSITLLESAERKGLSPIRTTTEAMLEYAATKPAIASDNTRERVEPILSADAVSVDEALAAQPIDGEARRKSRTADARLSSSRREQVDHMEGASLDEGIDPGPFPRKVEALRARAREALDDAAEPQFGPILASDFVGRRQVQELTRLRDAEREPNPAEPAFVGDATVINVTIGRIEVRAAAAPQTKTPSKDARTSFSPSSQLDVYLRDRNAPRR